MSFTKVDAKEKIERSFVMRGEDAVNVTASVKPSEASPVAFKWNYAISFANCTPQQIMLYAARHLHVVRQGQFRKAYTAEGADPKLVAEDTKWNSFFVKAYADQERQGATPMQRALAASGKMTEAEKQALIAALSK